MNPDFTLAFETLNIVLALGLIVYGYLVLRVYKGGKLQLPSTLTLIAFILLFAHLVNIAVFLERNPNPPEDLEILDQLLRTGFILFLALGVWRTLHAWREIESH